MPTPERWFAHSLSGAADPTRWEPLRDHLRAVGLRAREFAEAFGASDLGEAAGLLHDLGKYHGGFQRRLSGDSRRHDHSTAGAQVAVQRYGAPLGKLLAYAVAGHHAGLADGVRDGETQRTVLRERLRRPADAEAALRAALADGVLLPDMPSVPRLRGSTGQLHGFQLAFLGRMVFSCLVDADYLETERFYVEAGEKSVDRAMAASLVEMRTVFEAYLEREIAPRAHSSPVNQLRAEVLTRVREQANREPGVFTLTVPTGGGKTLTSLAFALDHAVRHGLRRIVNPKTTRSQSIGGMIGGIGMALMEHSVVGVAPAITNAIFHATGKRIRTLPVTPDKLL